MQYRLPNSINAAAGTSWCPGCGHGVICRILAEAIEELSLQDRIIMVEDVACGGFAKTVLKFNTIGAAHGRPIITAAGVKRVNPDAIVIAHPGDGSAYSIGIESTIHCALRNENILALVVNNGTFGMTGGQMSPTTILGMKTTSCPKGRLMETNGSPLNIVPLLSETKIAYLARGAIHNPGDVLKTKQMIKKALDKQLHNKGFCLVEVLSPCPTNWHLSPCDSLAFLDNVQAAGFSLGEFIDR